MTDQVECHSDYNYAERPTAILWNGQRLEITAILNQWRTPEGKHFRVHTSDEQQFELFYRENSDSWQILQL